MEFRPSHEADAQTGSFEHRFTEYLSGEKLWGDNFDREKINEWFEKEARAYAELIESSGDYNYQYQHLNQQTIFRYLDSESRFKDVVCLGAAFGHEVAPLEQRCDRFYIIEPTPSDFESGCVLPRATYLPATRDGTIELPDTHADLVTSFGVLHHIPNVTRLIAEVGRILKPGGLFLLREPIISMGDWTKPRRGLTPCERGIPLDYLRNALDAAGLHVRKQSLVGFAPLQRASSKFFAAPYPTKLAVVLDLVLCRAFQFNYRYHSHRMHEKFRPTSVALVVEKTGP